VWYTLGTWAWWLVLAALIGGVIGWLLRSIGAAKNADVAAAREEAARLRARVAELDGVAASLERTMQDMEVQKAQLPPPAAVAAGSAALAERAALVQQVTEQQHWISELRVRLWNSEAKNRDLQAVVNSHVVAAAPPEPNLGEAARVLGQPVRLNDFTLIEGIGPAIAHLLVNRGVTTWWSLANADLSLLRSMLAEAGPKYQVHDPTPWPQQARFLANGEWDKFQRLVDALRDGYDSE
jgi:predicted flap endonuclease-1-like 5' DNA nuclease